MTRPRIKRLFRLEILPGEGAFLLSETERVFLRGPVFCDLVPLLDGARTIDDIFAHLSERFPPALLFQALDELRRGGYLLEGATDTPQAEGAFSESLGINPDEARLRISRATVAISAIAGLDAEPLVALLASMGVRTARAPDDQERPTEDIHVILTDDYLRPEIEPLNRRVLHADRPLLLIKPVGIEIWIGPLFLPGRTGCWSCLAHRLRGHRRVERYLQYVKQTNDPFSASLAAIPSTRHTALAMAATEILKWIQGDNEPPTAGKVISLDTRTLQLREHPLTRRPQCPACGRPPQIDPRAPPPLVLEPRPRQFTADGGYRAALPADTAARMSRHISPITGIIANLRPGEAEDPTLTPTWIADHAFAEERPDPFFLHETLRKRAGGKGAQRDQAMASAIGEAIERYAGAFQGDEPRLTAARRDLGDAAIHPNACMGYSERQYAAREQSRSKGSRVHWVPEPFDDAHSIEWTPLASLSGGPPRYLPTSYCYYGYPGDGARFAAANSNGCASGNTLEEAILQGFLELVERDSAAIWWYNRLRRPAVDLASFDDPYIARLCEHYDTLGRELWAIDITSDLGIPACVAVSRRRGASEEGILLGFGAHLDARIALLRALTEVNQSLPAVSEPGGRPRYAGSNPDAARWFRTATVAAEPYLLPDAEAPATKLSDYPRLVGGDLRDDVLACVSIASERGLEALVLDQSRADVDLHVVRVVVPGLRHFWARFGPGRLYDVPVQAGWRAAPLQESDLNPWIVYF